ncbi:MFS transporter [Paraburkholderia sp. BL27I4N3]|uniref:MFS transporter n=1 Tax=Paraburkholderia sp. BL27I4N3 TaxID=1938805 RepID=UPI000E22610F|nr:MFS transporter [Paraburkholderia sp. BL27I4N3]REE07330.1 MFS transporter [Paraburkholderia sp. BL27I4N3]
MSDSKSVPTANVAPSIRGAKPAAAHNPTTDPEVVGASGSERLSRDARNVLIFVFLAWVVDAADSTIYSLTIPQIREEFGLSLATMGVIASVFLGGTVLGAALLPIIAEKKGRRIGMVVCVSLFSLFTGLVGIAQHAWVLTIGRFLTGCGTGAEWPIGAAYLSEMVPAKRRGAAMGFMQAGYPIGFFIAAGIYAMFSWLGWGWRACYLVLLLPAVMCLPIVMWLKESPAWLARRAAGVATTERPATQAVKFRDLFLPRYRRLTVISIGLHVFGAIFSYGLVVWVPSAIAIDFHFPKLQTAQFVMLSWGVGTFGYLLSGPLADRIGRKPTLTIYTAIGVAAVAYLNYLHQQPVVSFSQLIVPGALIGTSLGVSGIYIAYTSEIFPARLRTHGLGFSVAVGKVTALFVPAVLGWVAQYSSITTALLLSTSIGVLMLPVIFLGPETARKQLEDIVS